MHGCFACVLNFPLKLIIVLETSSLNNKLYKYMYRCLILGIYPHLPHKSVSLAGENYLNFV